MQAREAHEILPILICLAPSVQALCRSAGHVEHTCSRRSGESGRAGAVRGVPLPNKKKNPFRVHMGPGHRMGHHGRGAGLLRDGAGVWRAPAGVWAPAGLQAAVPGAHRAPNQTKTVFACERTSFMLCMASVTP